MKIGLGSFILMILLIILSGLISIHFVSFEWLTSKVNSASPDNDASSWNIDIFEEIKFNSIMAIILIGAIISFLVYKYRTLINYSHGLFDFTIEQLNKCFDIFKRNNFNQNLIIISIIGLAAFARFMLYNDAITYDEAFSANQYSTSSFINIISNYNYPNNHVFYNLIVKSLTNFLGSSEWAIRLPAFIAGILCLPFLFILGIKLFDNYNKATFLVSLFAFSPILIEYSALARGYSLIWLLSVWSFISIISYIKTSEKKYLSLFLIFNALALWTIPVAILPILVMILYLAVQKGTTTSLKLTLATFICTAILYLPILLIYGFNLSSKINLGVEESYSRLINYHFEHGLLDIYYNYIMTKPFYFGFIAILLLISIIKKSPINNLLLFAVAAITLLIVFQKTVPPARIWTVVLLFIYIPISNGTIEIIKNTKGIHFLLLPLVLLICQVLFNQKKTFIMTDFRYEHAEKIVSMVSEPTTVICAFPMEAPVKFYWVNYLRDLKDFNVVGDNLMVIVSLKHKQSIQQLCNEHGVSQFSLKLTFENKEVQVYNRDDSYDSNFVKFEY